jgi:hypothetical protein
MKLLISMDTARQIYSVVYETAFEIGVTLFGEKEGQDFIVTAIAGPGPRVAPEEPHDPNDKDYATMIFNDLVKHNSALKRIGQLYVHPFAMKSLRPSELDTVKQVLKECDEFIAGVILRNPSLWDFKVFPVYFSRSDPEGIEMVVQFEGQEHRCDRHGFRRMGRR